MTSNQSDSSLSIITQQVQSSNIFRTRAYLKNSYLYRTAAAVLGIYGNAKQEAMYPTYALDASSCQLDGANDYSVRLAPGKLPLHTHFASLTTYKLPAILLVANSV
jgi:hypothetical protein